MPIYHFVVLATKAPEEDVFAALRHLQETQQESHMSTPATTDEPALKTSSHNNHTDDDKASSISKSPVDDALPTPDVEEGEMSLAEQKQSNRSAVVSATRRR